MTPTPSSSQPARREGRLANSYMRGIRLNMRAKYFWPMMQQDTAIFVKRCDSCQRYGNIHRVLGEKMTTISSPWPFAQWGIDIMGPLPQGKRQMRFLLVSIDYITKWVETEALATITEAKVQNFEWKNIVCRFRYLGRSSLTMAASSTVTDSGHFAQVWASRTSICPQDILRLMDR